MNINPTPKANANPAATHGVVALLRAAARGERERACDLIDTWAVPVDATLGEYPTALCYAALLKDKRLVANLLRRGASAHFVDVDGLTPLHYAAWGGSDWIVAALIARGAAVNAVDHQGRTPLAFARNQVENTLCADLLYRHGGVITAGQTGPRRFH